MKIKIPVIAALVAVLLALFTLSAAADTIVNTANGSLGHLSGAGDHVPDIGAAAD